MFFNYESETKSLQKRKLYIWLLLYGSQNRQWCLSAHDHSKTTTHECIPARSEVLGGQKGAEAAAWILHSLIQWSLAVFTQPLRHLAFVRRTATCTNRHAVKSHPASLERHHLFTCGAELSLARLRHSERIACGVIFVLCVISAFLRFHPGKMATPAAVNPSGE